MAKTGELIGIAAALAAGIYAINKFGNNSEIRNDAKTDRVELRTEYREEKNLVKQTEKTNRVEARQETIKETVNKIFNNSNKSSGSSGALTQSANAPVKSKSLKEATSPTSALGISARYLPIETNKPLMTIAAAANNASTKDKKLKIGSNIVSAAIQSRPLLNVAKNIFSTGAKLLKR